MKGQPALVKQFISFSLKVIVLHTLTYFIAGAIAYPSLTKGLYVGSNPVFASFWRTEAEPVLWAHVTTWFLPAQLLRGLVLSIALYPFYPAMMKWLFVKRFAAIAGLYLGIGFWAAAVAAPGTIEGLVYMRPVITPQIHLIVQPEIIAQGIAFAAGLAAWMILVPKTPSIEISAQQFVNVDLPEGVGPLLHPDDLPGEELQAAV
jgi:hypothetical protein